MVQSIPKFKIGDKVKFIDSSKRIKINKNEIAFLSLNIPLKFFRLEGEVVGFFSYLSGLIRSKKKLLIKFNYKRFSFSDYVEDIIFLIPSTLVTFSKQEGNHPLTDIFCDNKKK